ncbi:MAG: single-stranded DNA-binding protein [Bacteroidales bacterium]|nr:single-stranded DNA-binding protein [Bacteroidales bacterium]
MEQLNRIELKGNVGSVKIIETATGKMIRFSLATNYLYRNKEGGAGVETTWHNIVAWEGKIFKSFDRIEKGAYMYVVGRVRNTRFTGADGTEKQGFEVVANVMQILEEDPYN